MESEQLTDSVHSNDSSLVDASLMPRSVVSLLGKTLVRIFESLGHSTISQSDDCKIEKGNSLSADHTYDEAMDEEMDDASGDSERARNKSKKTKDATLSDYEDGKSKKRSKKENKKSKKESKKDRKRQKVTDDELPTSSSSDDKKDQEKSHGIQSEQTMHFLSIICSTILSSLVKASKQDGNLTCAYSLLNLLLRSTKHRHALHQSLLSSSSSLDALDSSQSSMFPSNFLNQVLYFEVLRLSMNSNSLTPNAPSIAIDLMHSLLVDSSSVKHMSTQMMSSTVTIMTMQAKRLLDEQFNCMLNQTYKQSSNLRILFHHHNDMIRKICQLASIMASPCLSSTGCPVLFASLLDILSWYSVVTAANDTYASSSFQSSAHGIVLSSGIASGSMTMSSVTLISSIARLFRDVSSDKYCRRRMARLVPRMLANLVVSFSIPSSLNAMLSAQSSFLSCSSPGMSMHDHASFQKRMPSLLEVFRSNRHVRVVLCCLVECTGFKAPIAQSFATTSAHSSSTLSIDGHGKGRKARHVSENVPIQLILTCLANLTTNSSIGVSSYHSASKKDVIMACQETFHQILQFYHQYHQYDHKA